MAHFAKLDNNNIVLEVHVINNAEMLDAAGQENEEVGRAFLIQWSGGYTNWKQTSYNSNFRKNFAAPGYTYNLEFDALVPPKPFDSWILDTETAKWRAPIDYPQDGKYYRWDNNINNWIEV